VILPKIFFCAYFKPDILRQEIACYRFSLLKRPPHQSGSARILRVERLQDRRCWHDIFMVRCKERRSLPLSRYILVAMLDRHHIAAVFVSRQVVRGVVLRLNCWEPKVQPSVRDLARASTIGML
jgi:hypothetical protein